MTCLIVRGTLKRCRHCQERSKRKSTLRQMLSRAGSREGVSDGAGGILSCSFGCEKWAEVRTLSIVIGSLPSAVALC
jgi:hypothetical protein